MSCESRLLPDYGPVFRKEDRVSFLKGSDFIYHGLGESPRESGMLIYSIPERSNTSSKAVPESLVSLSTFIK